MKRFLGYWVFWAIVTYSLVFLVGNFLTEPLFLFAAIAVLPAALTAILEKQSDRIDALEERLQKLEKDESGEQTK